MSKLTKKHDPLARKFLSDVTIAKEFLSIYLVPELLAKCDLDTLQIESGSYVEDDLAVYYSDIVYRIDLRNDKGCAYIYNLIEHQSSAEQLMPFRILKYQLAVIQKYLDENEGSKELPIVVALVFYNGKQSPYPHYLDITQLFTDAVAYNSAPLGKFKLIDLTVTDDNVLLQHGKLALLEILIKHINERNFNKVINTIIAALKIGHDLGINHTLVGGAFSYIMNARETDEFKQLLTKINAELPDFKEDIMTYAEELRREGEQRGIRLGKQEGKQEGKLEGRQEAQQEIAKELLRSGVDKSIVVSATHLTLEQINMLKLK